MTEPHPIGRPLRAEPLHIMVLVGTDVHAFNRLVDWVERYDTSTTDVTWTLQYGSSRPSDLAGSSAFLDRETLASGLASAHVVVCHGGPATITEARRTGHIPLVVPRDPRQDEHVDDHQQRFARRLARSGMIELCETEEAFRAAVDRACADPGRLRIDPEDVSAAAASTALEVGRIADELVADAPIARIPRQRRREARCGRSGAPAIRADQTEPNRSLDPIRSGAPEPSDARTRAQGGAHVRPRTGPASAAMNRSDRATDPAITPADGSDRATRADVRVLYIGGWGRSGSTLTERLLGEMPDFVGAGEVTHLWQRGLRDNELCACGLAFRECPFWSAVGKEAFGGWDEVDADAVLRLRHRVDRTRFAGRLALPTRLTRRRAELHEYTALHSKVYAAIAAVSGATVVIDSSKHASLAFALRHQPSIDLRVLHLVRDGRGVAYSWSKEVRRPEAAGSDELMPQYSIFRSGLLWTAHNGLFHLLRLVHRRTKLMRYEDVIADPIGHLDTIRAFAGLPAESPSFLEIVDGTAVAQVGPSHSIAGNPMRFTSGRLVLRTDSAWRTERPRQGRFLIGVLTWPGRLRYGYLDRGKNT